MWRSVLPALISGYHIQASCLRRPEEDVGFPRTDITGGCEVPGAGWKLNPGPREEQAVLLTAEPSLQPYNSYKT